MRLIQKLSNSVLREDTLKNLIIIFAILGTAQMISGGIWDASSHALKEPEFFWSIQHVAVYFGVAVISSAPILSLFVLKQYTPTGIFKRGIQFVILGAILQISAGYADSVSHDVFGIDGLLSLSHQPLELGLVLSAIGAFFVLKSNPTSKLNRLLPVSIVTVIFSIMWLGFNLSLLLGGQILCFPVYEIFSSGCAVL
jgi:hypothetical protein